MQGYVIQTHNMLTMMTTRKISKPSQRNQSRPGTFCEPLPEFAGII